MAGVTRVVGRLLLAAIFILSGIMSFQHMDSMQEAIAGRMKDAGLQPHLATAAEATGMTADGIVQGLFMAALALKLIGGVAVALGGESCGAVMLLMFLAGVTPIMHAPTHTGEDAAKENQMEMIQILKNLSIAGGLLVMLAYRYETPTAPKAKKD